MAGPDEALRVTLFGDVAMEAWPAGDDVSGEPWDGFVRARRHLVAGDQDLAIREWAAIETRNGFGGVESRHLLQAWRFLRSVGIEPDASIADDVLGVVAEVAVGDAHDVLGVVAEVAVGDAHDVLAAYLDGSVRYLNHAGGSTIVDAALPDVALPATAVLAAGQALCAQIGPWTEPALPPLPPGSTRFTLLTRKGPRFGQGAAGVIQVDPLAAPLFAACTDLLVAIVALPPT